MAETGQLRRRARRIRWIRWAWDQFELLWGLLTSKVDREFLRLRLTRPHDLHQYDRTTVPNRYPALFTACQPLFGNLGSSRILSYGCSTGEEVMSLRRLWPEASLVGCDINRISLEIARRQDPSNEYCFPEQLQGLFDGIFCLAVLQDPRSRGEHVTSIARHYPYSKFLAILLRLDSLLKVGGFLILDHTNYRFEDSPLMERYVAMRLGERTRDRPCFAPDGHPIPNYQNLVRARIFRKIADLHSQTIGAPGPIA